MIAQLTFNTNDKKIVVTLNDMGTWIGPEPWIGILNSMRLTHLTGPSDGDPYYRHVMSAADLLNAKVVFEQKEPNPPGTIY